MNAVSINVGIHSGSETHQPSRVTLLRAAAKWTLWAATVGAALIEHNALRSTITLSWIRADETVLFTCITMMR